jgi:A/G-specific adenine glycosylase
MKKDILTLQENLLGWGKNNPRMLPWRKNVGDPYLILIAELLLKRTTASAVARLFPIFIEKYPTVQHLNNSNLEHLAKDLSPIGLNNQRAVSMKKMAEYIVQNHEGNIPKQYEELLKLPGLGQYGARAMMSFAYGKPMAIVDSNVVRIFRRVFKELSKLNFDYGSYQPIADKILPKSDHRSFNLALLDLGSLICKPVRPKCKICPLTDFCNYSQTGPHELLAKLNEDSLGLRKLRIKKGLSLLKLSEMSGVAKSTILNMESGKTRPRPQTLERLDQVLSSYIF